MPEQETYCPVQCYVASHGEERCPHGFGPAVPFCSREGCEEPNIISLVELGEGMPALCEAHFETAGYGKGD